MIGLRVEVDVVGVDVRDVVTRPVQLAADERVAGRGIGGDGGGPDRGFRWRATPVAGIGLPLDHRARVAVEHEGPGANRLLDRHRRVLGDLVRDRGLQHEGVAEDIEQPGVLRGLEVKRHVVTGNRWVGSLFRNAAGVGLRVFERLEGGGDVGRTECRAVGELHILANGDLQVLAAVLELIGGRQPRMRAGRGGVKLVELVKWLVDDRPDPHAG